jgi:hypothetical protein
MPANVTKSARNSGAKDDQFRDIHPCDLAEMGTTFGGTYSVHHPDEIIRNLKDT